MLYCEHLAWSRFELPPSVDLIWYAILEHIIEKLVDTKEVPRSSKSKMEEQNNDEKKKDKDKQ